HQVDGLPRADVERQLAGTACTALARAAHRAYRLHDAIAERGIRRRARPHEVRIHGVRIDLPAASIDRELLVRQVESEVGHVGADQATAHQHGPDTSADHQAQTRRIHKYPRTTSGSIVALARQCEAETSDPVTVVTRTASGAYVQIPSKLPAWGNFLPGVS